MTPQERFESYIGLAIHIAASYARRINRGDIGSDIHQEAKLGLWKACVACTDDTTFRSYVSRRVNGEILDFLRRQDTSREAARRERATGKDKPRLHHQERAELVSVFEARMVLDRNDSPEEVAIRSDFAAKLNSAIRTAILTAREREVVLCLYEGGLTQQETADHLKLSDGRVCQINRRAIEKIKGVALAA